jgi:hypothetical protein
LITAGGTKTTEGATTNGITIDDEATTARELAVACEFLFLG